MAPSFSVLTPVFDPVPDHLAACLHSVARQADRSRGRFEHVVVDDGSRRDPAVRRVLAAAAAGWRHVHVRAANGGIVAASADALARATGDWVVLLDHDDVLADDALAVVAAAIEANPAAEVVYSDHDVIRPDGRFADPVYKPDFSPERLRQTNYVTHLVAIRREALVAAGGFRAGTDGAQDHDVLLRMAERGVPFVHVPEVLLHWRQSPASVATDTANKPAAFASGVAVVHGHLERCGIEASVAAGPYDGVYRIVRAARPDAVVSVVVPTRGSMGTVWGVERTLVVEAVTSVVQRSAHRALEVVAVVSEGTPSATVERLAEVCRGHGVAFRTVASPEPFNFSGAVNAGVAASSGGAVLLLNDDTELIEPSSIVTMVSLLEEPSPFGPVGVVGAKLLYGDGTLQHGGHVYHGEFMHACIGWRGDHPGPQRMFAVERECAGVTAAALMVSRRVFDEVGGFPVDLPLHFNDVDFCLAVRERGYRVLFTPHASWYHFEGRSRSRGATMAEWARVAARWPDGRPHDPYANPNLAPGRADWLELPGRSGAPPYYYDEGGTKRWS